MFPSQKWCLQLLSSQQGWVGSKNSKANLLISSLEVTDCVFHSPWALDHSVLKIVTHSHWTGFYEVAKNVLSLGRMIVKSILSHQVKDILSCFGICILNALMQWSHSKNIWNILKWNKRPLTFSWFSYGANQFLKLIEIAIIDKHVGKSLSVW